MNDTPTGIAVNFTSASNDLIIFLEGGNACFNLLSCAVTANPNGYTATNFETDKPTVSAAPLFTRADPNPLKNYNYVFVPYCTGDVHGGDAQNVMVGNKPRNFHGYKNITEYLKRITATFPTPGKVILAGQSAGGFGAAYNYDQVSRAFGASVKVTMIDDSGPPMGTDFVPQCLQKVFSDTWGLAKTAPVGCIDCAPADGVFMEPLVNYITTTYADRNLGLISSTEDKTISQFWGYGNNDCADLTGAPPPYPPAEYTAGLADLRDRIAGPDANFFTYYIDGTDGSDKTRHVWTDDPTGVSSNGVLLTDWLQQLITDDPALTDVPPKM